MGEKEACMEAIKASMEDFREWNQSIYNAGRPLEMRQQGTKTWEATKQRVHEYLGYLYNFKGVKRPQLANYLDAQAFADFMAFVTARGVDKAGHTKAVHAAVRVVAWLKCQPINQVMGDEIKEHLDWLKNMGLNWGPTWCLGQRQRSQRTSRSKAGGWTPPSSWRG
ncbi:hypothetical protein MNEG_16241 [Monoraphidium neglectum]|uniref:Uncharacterized protein n=1 Tax=Monoraphidium neglectum TaxID=145388 RepID=A0A0D2K6C7_9CHLO|nr:hypothetical protein MNEG_16241 [Monoraphidium neglectum]KIY91723.1 hypothetical protein MNEG_16241 [Monoraphidium neglectum]|eukprot:XP_013890743.1 hypothetical protein MNEG_16241 [Monoraphidium neglectum]